jgi:hypothetical protein
MIKFKKRKGKNLKYLKKTILRLDIYRKYIRSITRIDFYIKHIGLVCHTTFFSGYSLNLLKQYFCSKVYETYNYKDNFDFLLISIKNQNYLYNYKFHKLLSKSIVFFFLTFDDIFLFLFRIKILTLSPYYFYPLFFINNKKNVLLPFSFLSSYFRKYKYEYYQNYFFYFTFKSKIKKIILIIFIFIFSKITLNF